MIIGTNNVLKSVEHGDNIAIFPEVKALESSDSCVCEMNGNHKKISRENIMLLKKQGYNKNVFCEAFCLVQCL